MVAGVRTQATRSERSSSFCVEQKVLCAPWQSLFARRDSVCRPSRLSLLKQKSRDPARIKRAPVEEREGFEAINSAGWGIPPPLLGDKIPRA